MTHYFDLDKEFERLVEYVKKGKMEIESISLVPHLQPRYLTDDLKETEIKNKLEYYEYNITIRDLRK